MASNTATLSEEAKTIARGNIRAYLEEGNNAKALELARKIGDDKLVKESTQRIISWSVKNHYYGHAIETAEGAGEREQAKALRQQEIDYITSSFRRRRDPRLLLRASEDATSLDQREVATELLERAAWRQFKTGEYVSATRTFKKLGQAENMQRAYKKAVKNADSTYREEPKVAVAKLAEEIGDPRTAIRLYMSENVFGKSYRAFELALAIKDKALVMSVLPQYAKEHEGWVQAWATHGHSERFVSGVPQMAYEDIAAKTKEATGDQELVNMVYRYALKDLEGRPDYANAAYFAEKLGLADTAKLYRELQSVNA